MLSEDGYETKVAHLQCELLSNEPHTAGLRSHVDDQREDGDAIASYFEVHATTLPSLSPDSEGYQCAKRFPDLLAFSFALLVLEEVNVARSEVVEEILSYLVVDEQYGSNAPR